MCRDLFWRKSCFYKFLIWFTTVLDREEIWLLITDYWWMMSDDWWLMINYWWLMSDYWLLMIDYWLLIIDYWWHTDYLITDYWLLMSRKRWGLVLAFSQHQSIISKAFFYYYTSFTLKNCQDSHFYWLLITDGWWVIICRSCVLWWRRWSLIACGYELYLYW